MDHPIDIKRSLKPLFFFRICVGLSAKGRVFPTKRAVERFTVVGVDIFIFDILFSIWMLRVRCLILRSLRSSFMRLGSFVLHPDLYSFSKSFTWTSLFAVMDQVMTDIEQDIAISALTIRNQGEVLRLVNESFQGSQGFIEKFAVLLSTPEFPKKTTGPVHEYNCPAKRFIRGCILPDSCIDLIAFDN